MRRDPRAVIFDLDDTLYPLDGFVLSGFDAVADHLHRQLRLDVTSCRTVLRQAFHAGARGRELQVCLRHFDLPEAMVPALIEVIREHRPSLTLPSTTARALGALTPGWKIGIVTNGIAEIQARKVRALGLGPCVDAIVFADGVATPEKPAAAPFLAVARLLGVEPERAVFVGDDVARDVVGASRLGMKTIHLAGDQDLPGPPPADACVRSIVEVPDVAERLVH